MGTARGNQQESGNRGVLTTDDTDPATAGRMGKMRKNIREIRG
jgi:hypothetical protein